MAEWTDDIEINEQEIKQTIISKIDEVYDSMMANLEKRNASEEEIEKTESCLMSYRNVLAGTNWDGNKQEYEKYNI